MNRFFFTLSVLILGVLLSACASLNRDLNVAMVNDMAKSGIIIERLNSYDDQYMDLIDLLVYVDGEFIGRLYPGEIKGYELTNGNHTLQFTYNLPNLMQRQTDSMRFMVNNDRHYLKWSGYDEVVSYDITPIEAPVPVKQRDTKLLDTAITDSFNTVSRNIPINSKIAIVNIASDNNADSSFILEELTLAFVNSKRFTVVDRQTLNVIREEQNFQLSGEVSDETIISVGKFTGADIVITGAVSGNGEMRRLRLRALDVQTAQILAMSAEKI